MTPRREVLIFAFVLATLVAGLLHEALFTSRILSPADVVFVQKSFEGLTVTDYEPENRLLMDPVLQFEPWLEFNREAIRNGRLPLWNPYVGCGAPHLANGQSAVFDPFHTIAYLGTLPEALGWMAALRLWTAGFGMFLLVRLWGFGPWGRWFCGLSFPLCGFLIAWLLYPVTSVAVWLPWLLWATERLIRKAGPGTIASVGLIAGFVLLGGHVQTSAHVLLAAGLYLLARWGGIARSAADWPAVTRPTLAAWTTAITIGIALAAIEIVPLGFYLSKSLVWTDRQEEQPPPWQLARPRWAEIPCTAFPYLYGSQRRGHPHLARAVHSDNLNEAAGGFAGLPTLLLLAPLGWKARRHCPPARFLTALAVVGALGSFRIPPVDNLLRALPVLDVIDHRRLTLWIAFGLIGLGGIGLDHLAEIRRQPFWKYWLPCWFIGALALIFATIMLPTLEPMLRTKALEHYNRIAETSFSDLQSQDPGRLAEGQVQKTLRFLPRYYANAAAQLLGLAAFVMILRRKSAPPLPWFFFQAALLLWTLTDLLGFGLGLNPAISAEAYRPASPVISYLQREAPLPARILALGTELPPNILMRYRLADVRNYDSVELTRNLTWFDQLYEQTNQSIAQTSRRDVTWTGVIRAQDRLRAAGVTAVVGSTPPPEGSFSEVDRVGSIWIARLNEQTNNVLNNLWIARRSNNQIDLSIRETVEADDPSPSRFLRVFETFDSGWRAIVDGQSVAVECHAGAFLSVELPPDAKRVSLRYDPPEVRAALLASTGAFLVLATLCGGSIFARAKIWPKWALDVSQRSG